MSSRMQVGRLPVAHAAASGKASASPTSKRHENNHTDAADDACTEMKKESVAISPSDGKQPSPLLSTAFPSTEYLLQAVEDAIYGGAFQGASEHRIRDLLVSAKREIKAQNQHVAQLEQRNEKLAADCTRYRVFVSKIQSHSETLRSSSNGKDVHVQKLVALLRELHGYEEPEFPEDDEQQQRHRDDLKQLEEDDEHVDDDEDDDEDREGSESDESHLCSSNQMEEDQVDDDPVHSVDVLEEADANESVQKQHHGEVLLLDDLKNHDAAKVVPVSIGTFKQTGGGKQALSLTVPMKKAIHEPKPPRGRKVAVAGDDEPRASGPKSSRLKFQFPDTGLNSFLEGDGDGCEDEDDDAPNTTFANTSPSRMSSFSQKRRFSYSAAISTTVPLRRKSFTMKRSPVKGIAVTSEKTGPVAGARSPSATGTSGPNRWATRRKSTSACYSTMRGATSRSSPAKWKHGVKDDFAQGARGFSSSSPSPRSSQMIVRVRERKLDGIPELVIRKKPARFVVWQWNERQVRIPFMIQLGPHQHGIMLRQLRYVKSVMHDFPWAKAHLKDLLSSYTKKDMSKEQLYPQLNHLSHHVQEEIGTKVKKQKLLASKKHHLTLQLTIAAGVVNDLHMTKFGRRGKPHDTKLCYDPSDPTRLHWLRKNGEKSDEFLPVHEIEIHGDSKLDTSVIQRAARKYPLDPECCVSLVTSIRNLDLQLKCPLQRDWLVNALRDIVSFARQYRAAGAISRRQQSHQDLRALTVHHGKRERTRSIDRR